MTLQWIALSLVGIVVAILVFVSRRDAAYRRCGLLPAPGEATMADVERLVREGQKLAAIRCYREIHHCGLAEAKNAVDNLHLSAAGK